MKKKIGLYRPVFYILLGMCAALTLLLYFSGNRNVFYAGGVILVCGAALVLLRMHGVRREIRDFLVGMGDVLSHAQRESLIAFPMPICVADEQGEILWYNQLFRDNVLDGEDKYGSPVSDIAPELTLNQTGTSGGREIAYKDNTYIAYVVSREQNGSRLNVVYFVDITQLYNFKKEYLSSRPSVLVIMIDNYDEFKQSAKEADRAQLMNSIETMLEGFVRENGGLGLRVERDRYVAVIEERFMGKIIEGRFNLLDKVRSISPAGYTPATLSIGIGRGASTFTEGEQMAKQALDMALGRGGDQAAIKTLNGYEFYGGVSKGVEKSSKVRIRIIATALEDLIRGSENVVIMGHKMADFDCFGASVGLLRIARQMGKSSVIAINRQANLSDPLIDMMEQAGYASSFIDPEEIIPQVGKKTLLIVVDTHVKHFLESEALFDACEMVVVIDHHRKSINHIDNSLLFFHEPHASSTCEMVTELIQFLGDKYRITPAEANALMAGIMLDTKNFVIKSGVRTFEAAAYLRKAGADTVQVKELFSSNRDIYQERARLIAYAEVYRGCAVAQADEDIRNPALASPQAADELLGVEGVDASFVLYKIGEQISISARSLGKLNVQLVMETLGGGGHLTMAGAQLAGVNMDEARAMLMQAIDGFLDEKEEERA